MNINSKKEKQYKIVSIIIYVIVIAFVLISFTIFIINVTTFELNSIQNRISLLYFLLSIYCILLYNLIDQNSPYLFFGKKRENIQQTKYGIMFSVGFFILLIYVNLSIIFGYILGQMDVLFTIINSIPGMIISIIILIISVFLIFYGLLKFFKKF